MKKVCFYDMETENFLSDVHYRFDQLNMVCGIIIDQNTNEIIKFVGKDAIKDLYNKLIEYDVIISFNGLQFDNLVVAQSACNFFDMNYWNEQTLGFGQHRDLTWKDVPKDYLKWMLDKDVYPKMLTSIIYYYNCLKKKEELDYSFSDQVLLTELNNRTFDLFQEIKLYTELDYPVTLNDCISLTINKTKLDNITNKMIPQMFKEGKIDEIVEYCIQDVKVLQELFEFSQKYGYVLIPQIKKSNKYKDFMIRVPINFTTEIVIPETNE